MWFLFFKVPKSVFHGKVRAKSVVTNNLRAESEVSDVLASPHEKKPPQVQSERAPLSVLITLGIVRNLFVVTLVDKNRGTHVLPAAAWGKLRLQT